MKTKEELNLEFDEDMKRLDLTYDQSEAVYFLKNYIDARLRMLENKKQNGTNDN